METPEMPLFGRVLTAMITPFDGSGNVDHDETARLAQWLVAHGSDGLVVTGTTGESATLSHAEKVGLYQTVVKAVGGKAKVLAGTGSYDTAETIMLIPGGGRNRRGRPAGCDALLQQALAGRSVSALQNRCRSGHAACHAV